MFKNKVVLEILDNYKSIWSLDSANSLFGWDLETNMPVEGIEARSNALAEIAVLKQKMIQNLNLLVSRAKNETDLNDQELGVLRVMNRTLHFYNVLPASFIETYNKITAQATIKWREAREKSDFKMFKPYLEKIVELSREEADYLGYVANPYNALLDLYEEGMRVSDLDSIFSRLSSESLKIKNKVMSENYFPQDHPLEHMKYDVNAMREVNFKIIKLLDMPTTKFRMDVSTHPFTTKIGPDDVRITTRYEGTDFKKTMYSTIHESGHAIHALQQDPELNYTPIADSNSLGIGESQSRFWENVIGRSRAFINKVYPIIKSELNFVSKYSAEDIYRYVNTVRSSLIRVDADELTYNFHIILRYNIEKDLISGKINVDELPTVWNDMMGQLLDIVPKNDKEGVLQDTHWSNGSFGYFPTYSLGNIIAGMIWFKLNDKLESMSYLDMKQWLYQNIHRWGSIYDPKTLQQQVFGEHYNSDRLIQYLDSKYVHF
ncbi:MAG: carboxypeptidase M32 [Thermoplasmata archaeon]